jgi:hypothetical protein
VGKLLREIPHPTLLGAKNLRSLWANIRMNEGFGWLECRITFGHLDAAGGRG